MHRAEKGAAGQEVEARKGNQKSRLKVFVAHGQLQFANFLQSARVLQLFQAVGFVQLLELVIQAWRPLRKTLRCLAQGRFKHAGHFFQRSLIQSIRRAVGEVLHQEKINLVFVRLALMLFVQMAGDQVAQVFFVLQAGALQELTQLPDLHVIVDFFKPLQHSLHRHGFRTIVRLFQFSAGRHAELEGAVQFGIDGVQPARNAPEVGQLAKLGCSCCSHL